MKYEQSKMRSKKVSKSYDPRLPGQRHGYIRGDGTRTTSSSFSVTFDLLNKFRKACYKNETNISAALRKLMKGYVATNRKTT